VLTPWQKPVLICCINNGDGTIGDDDGDDGNAARRDERVTTQWRVVGGSSLHNTVEVFTNKKSRLRYIEYLLNSGIVFCPKVILPPTTTSDLLPLQWCEPNTHLKNMCF
jgi:hypothetical protein